MRHQVLTQTYYQFKTYQQNKRKVAYLKKYLKRNRKLKIAVQKKVKLHKQMTLMK